MNITAFYIIIAASLLLSQFYPVDIQTPWFRLHADGGFAFFVYAMSAWLRVLSYAHSCRGKQ